MTLPLLILVVLILIMLGIAAVLSSIERAGRRSARAGCRHPGRAGHRLPVRALAHEVARDPVLPARTARPAGGKGGGMKPIVAQALSRYDQYRTLLTKAVGVLSEDTLATWLSQLEYDMHCKDLEVDQRLEAHAMLVGVLGVMLDALTPEPRP